MTMLRAAGVSLRVGLLATGCSSVSNPMNRSFRSYLLDYSASVDAPLQSDLEQLDARLRNESGRTTAPLVT